RVSNVAVRSEVMVTREESLPMPAGGHIAGAVAGKLTRDGEEPRHLVHAAAAGINVQFASFATRADLRARFGRLTYAVAMAIAMKEPPIFSCEVESEGRSVRLRLVHLAVINAPTFSGLL